MNKPLAFVLCLLVLASSMTLADPPEGFEDPGLLAKVLNGDIVIEDIVDIPLEFRSYGRSYFDGVSSEAFVEGITDHARWPDLIGEVKEAKTTKINADQTEFDFWAHMIVNYLFFTYEFYPEGRQTISPAPDILSETKIYSVITNYQEEYKMLEMDTRLIPYETGILVEDDIHIVLVEESLYSDIAKKEAKKKYLELMTNLRKDLQSN